MSFGRPPTFSDFKVSPPERGSFPLDHEGECKSVMQEYMACIKAHRNDNGKCRHLSKAYLQCRMDKGLMERDDMENLGFKGVGSGSGAAGSHTDGGVAAKVASSPAGAKDTKSDTANSADDNSRLARSRLV